MSRTFEEYYEKEVRPSLSQVDKELQASFEEAFTRAAQLAARRIELELTQAEVAARAGLTQADVSRLERGLGNPTEETLERLAVALDSRWKHELVPEART